MADQNAQELSQLLEKLKLERDEAVAKCKKLEEENSRLKGSDSDNNNAPKVTVAKGDNILHSSRSRLSKRVSVKDIQKDGLSQIGESVLVAGWIRTTRLQGGGRFIFLEVYDGSCFKGVQVVLDKDKPGFDDINGPHAGTGACVVVLGKLVKSEGGNQAVEILADEIELHGKCTPDKYPLAKGKINLDTLRGIAHLRPRTNTIGAVARIRNSCAIATHLFFQAQGFLYVHTPLITASDCEGAGEMFQVTTLLKNGEAKLADVPVIKEGPSAGKPDYSQDFFAKPSFLTVSGQLNGEMYATALSKVYTFGPTFRAEDSHTSRHLAEFWMIEPEIAFADLEDNMDYAEGYLKFVIKYVMDHNREDLEFCDKWVEKGLIQRIQHVLDTPFKRLTYTEAIEILIECDAKETKKEKKFVEKVSWGIDLASEHERYLAEQVFKQPVILTNYPKDIKAFYMRLDEDGKTVRAMDVLVPKIGELIGGSQREERLEVLESRIEELKLDKEAYKYYLDLRRYGSCVHSGFGLGFERLVMFVSGIENIRDSIPFPRYPGHADF
jgi:asparaginyl-tRNA synthetase